MHYSPQKEALAVMSSPNREEPQIMLASNKCGLESPEPEDNQQLEAGLFSVDGQTDAKYCYRTKKQLLKL
jgi:hypothetical protein